MLRPVPSARRSKPVERSMLRAKPDRDPKIGRIPDNFEDEVKQTLENIGVILKAAGYSFEDAVSVQVYLTDMDLFQRMNAVYMPFFPEPRPARATVGVARLVGTAKIEISVTAWKKQ